MIRPSYQVASLREKLGEIFEESSMRIGIGALSLCTIFGGAVYYFNAVKAERTPVAFSEFGKTARIFESQGKPVPPLTHFYSITNDIVMQVFEAKNISNERSFFGSAFPAELEFKTDPGVRVHRLLGERAREIPEVSRDALISLDKFVQAANELPAVTTALDKSWDDSHHDVTHTEYEEETVCDFDGNNCHTETTSREVYDYTVHTYDYHPEQARKADVQMAVFLKKHPDLKIEESLIQASSTEADNEYAIEKSMPDIFKGKIAAGEEALALANSWATGSNLTKYQPVISSNLTGLEAVAPKFNAALKTAQSARYTTYSHTDAGPKEFQSAGRALNHALEIYNGARHVIDGVAIARRKIPELEAKIHEYIGVALDGKAGDKKALEKEVIALATDIYQKNFENGLDVEPFKWKEVFLAALFGGMLGGLGGAGFDRYRRRGRYGTY